MLMRLCLVLAALCGISGIARAQTSAPHESDATSWERLMATAEGYRRGGRYDEAERACAAATALVKAITPLDKRLGEAQEEMGYIQFSQGKFDQAAAQFQNALATCEQAAGPNDPTVQMALGSLVNCYDAQKKFALAVPLCERIVAIAQHAVNEQNRELAKRLEELAGAYFSNQQLDAAKSTMKDAIDLARLCGDADGELQYRLVAARAEEANGDIHAALDDYTRGLTAATKAANTDMTFQFQQAIADIDCAAGDYPAAEALAQQSLALREKENAPGASVDAQLNVAICHENLGKIYLAASRPSDAQAQYAQAVNLAEKAGAAETGELVHFLAGLAASERAAHHLTAAAAHYERAISIATKTAQSGILPDLYEKDAAVLTEQHRPDAARIQSIHAAALRAATTTQPAPTP